MYFPDGNSDFRDNPNPPQIRFIRKGGRIIPIVNRKKLTKSSSDVELRLVEMASEVREAQKGFRGANYDESTGLSKGFGVKSTYPKFYSQIKFKNKDHFNKVFLTESGNKYEQLVDHAIKDLKEGYESPSGFVPRNLRFRVATKQTFDNRKIVFRKIDGIVRPLRFGKVDPVPQWEK